MRPNNTFHAIILVGDHIESLARAMEQMLQADEQVYTIEPTIHQGRVRKEITVDDIRQLREYSRVKQRQAVVVTISQADVMSAAAQNALLKLLEEPKEDTRFILATRHPQHLLATVRSRAIEQRIENDSSPRAQLTDEATRQQAQFMSRGSKGEYFRLLNDEAYFKQRSAIFEAAKQYVAGSNRDKLLAISRLKDNREAALDFIAAVLYLFAFMTRRQHTERFLDQLTSLADAERLIAAGGNIRIQLARTVV